LASTRVLFEITGRDKFGYGEFTMNRRLLFIAFILLIGARMSLASPTIKAGTWTGIVTDTITAAADSEPARVTENVKEHGALYAFLDYKTQRVYVLKPQNVAAPYAGRAVTVKGTLDSATITITVNSIAAAPAKTAK
jgi:hypothetical protein